jgi:hypothetical protein
VSPCAVPPTLEEKKQRAAEAWGIGTGAWDELRAKVTEAHPTELPLLDALETKLKADDGGGTADFDGSAAATLHAESKDWKATDGKSPLSRSSAFKGRIDANVATTGSRPLLIASMAAVTSVLAMATLLSFGVSPFSHVVSTQTPSALPRQIFANFTRPGPEGADWGTGSNFTDDSALRAAANRRGQGYISSLTPEESNGWEGPSPFQQNAARDMPRLRYLDRAHATHAAPLSSRCLAPGSLRFVCIAISPIGEVLLASGCV